MVPFSWGIWRTSAKNIYISGGPARARNLGRDSPGVTSSFWIDVSICPDALNQIANALERKPDLAAVIGSYDDVPGAPNFLSQYRTCFTTMFTRQQAKRRQPFGVLRSDSTWSSWKWVALTRVSSTLDWRYWAGLSAGSRRVIRFGCADFAGQAFKALGCGLVAKSWLLLSCFALDWADFAWSPIYQWPEQLSSRVSVILTYGLVSSLVGAWWLPGSLAIAGVMIVLLWCLMYPCTTSFCTSAVYGLPSSDSVALALLLLQWLSIRHRHSPPRPQAQRFQGDSSNPGKRSDTRGGGALMEYHPVICHWRWPSGFDCCLWAD